MCKLLLALLSFRHSSWWSVWHSATLLTMIIIHQDISYKLSLCCTMHGMVDHATAWIGVLLHTATLICSAVTPTFHASKAGPVSTISIALPKDMLHQLSHFVRSSFLGMGILYQHSMMPSVHSLGTWFSFNTTCTKSRNISINHLHKQAAFALSGRMFELPPAFAFFDFPTACFISLPLMVVLLVSLGIVI